MAVLVMKWVHKEEEEEMEKSWCGAERRGRNVESEEKQGKLEKNFERNQG